MVTGTLRNRFNCRGGSSVSNLKPLQFSTAVLGFNSYNTLPETDRWRRWRSDYAVFLWWPCVLVWPRAGVSSRPLIYQ